jgi:hypothetical protein
VRDEPNGKSALPSGASKPETLRLSSKRAQRP